MEFSHKAEEYPLSSPTKRRKKESNEEKTSFGTSQFQHLLRAMKEKSIFTGQGKSARSVEDVSIFLQSKIKEAMKKKSPDITTFDYLYHHQINTPKKKIESIIKTLLEQHGNCYCFENHHQLKIPSNTMKVTPSDEKNGKVRGIIQIQTYNVVELLGNSSSDEQLQKLIEERISNSSTKQVGAHLCKKTCIKHTISISSSINMHNHECCPAYWIVNGNLINFCTCTSTALCLAPGQYFNAYLFKKRQEEFMSFCK